MRVIRYIITAGLLLISGLSYAANSMAFFEQGMEAFKSANYKNAELLFRKSVDVDDENNDKAWFYLSRSIYSQKRYKDAIFEFNRFLLNCRNNDLCIESRFWIAESEYALNAYIKAIEEYKRFITMVEDRDNPLVSLSHERIGDIYYRQNRMDEAIIEWKTAINKVRDEGKSVLTMKLARALIKNTQFDEAESVVMPLTGDKDQSIAAESNLYLGRINYAKGKHRNALKYFSKIPENLRVTLPYSEMYYYSSLSYSELGEKDNMLNSLQTFVGIAKGSSVYYEGAFLLAQINEARNADESSVVFEDVRANTSDKKLKIKASIELAKIYSVKGNPEKAVTFLEEFRSEEEGETGKQLQFELGSAYLSAKMLQKAADVFTHMIEVYQYDQDVDRMQFLLSVVDLKKGDSGKAAEGFKKIKDINPFSKYISESQYYIATAHFDQGEYAQAVKYSEKYLSVPSVEKKYESLVLQMRSYLKMGDLKRAGKIALVLMKRYQDKLGLERNLFEFVASSYEISRDPKVIENFIIKGYPGSDAAADIFLIKGNIEYNGTNWKKAEQHYSSALRVKGNEALPEIFYRKALCLFNQLNYNGVIQLLTTEQLRTFSNDVSVKIVVLLARSYYKSELYDKAYETISAIKDHIQTDDDMLMYFESAVRTDNLIVSKNILNVLKIKRDIYYSALMVYGEYYRDIYNNEMARNYFSQIYADNPDKIIGERALLELAVMDMREKKYEDMIERMKGVRSKEFEQKKIFYSVTALIKLSRIQDAMDMFRKGSSDILKSESGRTLMRDMIVALSEFDSIDDILNVGKTLSLNFPAENDFVNYYIGNYYYKKSVYDKSLKYFTKVSVYNADYKSEILYKIGIIYELGLKNHKSAIYYFSLLQDVKDYDEYIAAARVELAILYYERGWKEQSRRLLDDVIKRKGSIAVILKATNLYSYYGFDKSEGKK